FFFSSRRRHTRWPRDWSSDVCLPILPTLGPLRTAGTAGDVAAFGANFRDEYYGMVGAVRDDADGPPLVTSGLIDPGACAWGHRKIGRAACGEEGRDRWTEGRYSRHTE